MSKHLMLLRYFSNLNTANLVSFKELSYAPSCLCFTGKILKQ